MIVALGYSRDNYAKVFSFNTTTSLWNQLGTTFLGESANEYFGSSISISTDGLVVAISAPFNVGDGISRGYVKVYDWNGTQWNQRGTTINGISDGNQFGYKLSLSANGNILAISSANDDIDGSGYNKGVVRVYEWNTSIWIQKGSLISGDSHDQNGSGLQISSDGLVLAIGARVHPGGGTERGRVRVFVWDTITSLWSQRGSDINGDNNDDIIGDSVSLSANGNILAIGFPRGNYVKVFTWNNTEWIQRGVNINGEANNNSSGQSVSLSENGLTIAIGAPYNAGGGISRGHTRVYKWNETIWNQVGLDIDGEADYDTSGSYVSISADGLVVAIGATYNIGSGGIWSGRGHVRVYKYSTISLSPLSLNYLNNTTSNIQTQLNSKTPLVIQHFASDLDAQNGGIPLYGLYRTNDTLKMRIS